MQLHRNIESEGTLYLNRFWTGMITNRSPLFTPMSAMGIQMIARQDALWDGLNCELSPRLTLVRRFGFTKYCSSAFGSSDYPLAFYSFKNLTGTIKLLVDTPTKVYSFTTSAITAVFTKSTTAQSSFGKVGSTVYWCDGTSAKKWNGTTVSNWGISSPSLAPTLNFSSGSLSPTVGYKYVYVYKNSSTGHISTASAASANTGPLSSKNISVGYTVSADGQVDDIDIYRTLDGGSTYYYLATVSNATSTYTDSTADSGLNTDLVAPLSHSNDAPPSGISLACFHMGRFWVASGNTLYYAGGPDTTNGVGAEAFPPANNFVFPGAITALASTSQGLVVWTSDNAYVIVGTDLSSFTQIIWQVNFGVANQNCITQDGDILFVYTTKGQLFQFASGNLTEIGDEIADKLAAMTPTNVYLALHRSGADEGLFVSDGSTNVWRFSLKLQAWSPVAQPTGGVKAIASLETTTANWTLVLGKTAGSGYITYRNPSAFSDDGTAFASWVVIGSIVLAAPKTVADVEMILLEEAAIGTYPTLSVLLNEISGTFTSLPNPVSEPFKLAGTTYEPSTLLMKGHYLKSAASPLPQQVRHLQVKVDFGNSDTVQNELVGVGIG